MAAHFTVQYSTVEPLSNLTTVVYDAPTSTINIYNQGQVYFDSIPMTNDKTNKFLLIKNQDTEMQWNGIYILSSINAEGNELVLTRQDQQFTEFTNSIFIREGNLNYGKVFTSDIDQSIYQPLVTNLTFSLVDTCVNSLTTTNATVKDLIQVTGSIINNNLYSIDAAKLVRATGFINLSDERIKKDIKPISPEECLKKIDKIQVYSYVDIVTNQPSVGLIAQEVEKFIPEAVSSTTDFIPNIMQNSQAQRISISNPLIQFNITHQKGMKLQPGTILKVFSQDNVQLTCLIKSYEKGKLIVDGAGKLIFGQTYFIYGRQVSDFKSVDYPRVLVMCLGAIQELKDKIKK